MFISLWRVGLTGSENKGDALLAGERSEGTSVLIN